MRSLLLSLMTIGLIIAGTSSALADGPQAQNSAPAAAYLTNAADHGAITPVARYYYGRPAWRGRYGYRAWPGYGYYYLPYYARPRTYTYFYPGYTYGYSYYPFEFYYGGPRVQFGFGF